MSSESPMRVRTPSDVLAVLLSLTDERLLQADPGKLHHAVLLGGQFAPALSDFRFSAPGPQPMSRALEDALGVLKLFRIVRMENTDYDRLIIDDRAREYVLRELLPKFTDKEVEELKRAAAIVREACRPVEAEV